MVIEIKTLMQMDRYHKKGMCVKSSYFGEDLVQWAIAIAEITTLITPFGNFIRPGSAFAFKLIYFLQLFLNALCPLKP